jgi:ATP-dependent metalloprotease
MQNKVKLEMLRKTIKQEGGMVSDQKLVEYLRTMTAISPRETVQMIESGWQNKKVPMSEPIMKEYFKAVGALGKLDSININGLMAYANANGMGAEAMKAAGGAGNYSMGSMGMGAAAMSAGGTPTEPIYVAQADRSWKSEMWKFARGVVGIFLFLSFAGAVLDDQKSGGGGGLGGRLAGYGSAVHQAENSDKSFDDVVGIDEAKGELVEIVQYLKNPRKFTRLGGKLPKGVLLTGPPGTGKTLLARAIAGEAGVPFFYSSGSEFEEMFVGVGAARVRKLFEAAKAKSPCIIFIDEIDAIGGSRQEKDQSAMKMTLNQLLVEMDGFEQNNGVIVIAATNFPQSLDQALIRPGRFDKQVDVPMPDIGGRKAILDLYSQQMPVSDDVDMEQIARGTPGFSGAELFNLINQAAIKASVEGLKSISMGALEYAKDKIMMGVERKSAIISKETMKMTAFHEAGHALVALKTDGADPIHKATIMPRGRALGMVMQLPDGDQTSYSRKQMLARLDVCMGGRVAEEIVYGHDNVTSGASSDIQQASQLARAMVTKYGLSEKVGVLFLDEKSKIGGKTQTDVDDEVNKLLTDSYARAKALLNKHRRDLDTIAKGLQDYESLSGGEIVDLINGKPPSSGVRSQRPSRPTEKIPPSKGSADKAAKAGRGAAVSAKDVASKRDAASSSSSDSSASAKVSQTPAKAAEALPARKESAKAGLRGPPKQ